MTKHDYSTLPKWAQLDISDMENSHCTQFVRCPNPGCERIHDDGYCCVYCDCDHTQEEEEL